MLDELTESFINDVVVNAASVPVVITDTSRRVVVTHGNIDTALLSEANLPALIKRMEQDNPPIEVSLTGKGKNLIFYENSVFYNSLREILDNRVQKFLVEVVTNATAVPVIITDSAGTEVVAFGGGVTPDEFSNEERLTPLI